MFYRYPNYYKFQVIFENMEEKNNDLFRGEDIEETLYRKEQTIYEEIDDEFVLFAK